MITEKQYWRLLMSANSGKSVAKLAASNDMDEKTARKYLKNGQSPNELKKPHTWRTREDPFEKFWEKILPFLQTNSNVEAKTLFDYLLREHSGELQDGQLRTLQRKIKHWKATEGPSKETIFPQVHYPGDLCGIDYTHMDKLGITIKKELFKHLIFHFVLTSSNWETGNICYSESLESLIDGLQKALWQLGGVPKRVRSDNLTAAIKISSGKKAFTDRFAELLKHYNLEGIPINAGKAQENGDVEQRNNRFKKAVEQSLILRGSRDFDSIDEYNNFLQKLFKQLNQGRREKFLEEIPKLQSLPKTKLDSFKETYRRVGPSSTVVISHNTYSVHSRLIGEQVKVRLKASTIEIYLGSKKVEEFPRLRGSGGHKIDYRHIINSLIRKPGAFENYRYKDDLFPTVHFRMAFDTFKKEAPTKSPRDYLQLLKLSADEGENKIDNAIREIFNSKQKLTLENIKQSLKTTSTMSIPVISVSTPSLTMYNDLLVNAGGLYD